ncbi:twin-arginine translocase subunit TatC [Saccharophagus sp. K07]|jgi:sec-independent protein translocase protein TatC|uniref:twin-arginine translocase subunit TatC n=1 Tax=Saccharophagus sp. K07 TaxID=2283636 RepID=UPI0016522D15|nr:twin-arginine translocase subunit TatC [Saccharophagus sp. K07]MBC6906366.1 twin-arginine translocase subunit TatC [Saccharophagus sp. K07]
MTHNNEPEEQLPAQPFIEHLIELRTRLLKAIVVLIVILCGLLYFSNDIYEFVADPLLKHLPAESNSSLIVTDVTQAFLTPFKLTFFVAVFVSMPFLLYQLWAFIAPALYQNEKSLAIPIFISSVILFYLGVAFAYFVVFPMLFEFFTAIAPQSVTVMPDIASHLSLVIKLFFAFGFAFEIPVATIILIVAGVISPEGLAQKRPYVIVGCFVIGMVLTPPDVFSQAMLAVPMWGLFELGVFFGKFLVKKKSETESESEV